MNIHIFSSGGFSHEAFAFIKRMKTYDVAAFVDKDREGSYMGYPIIREDDPVLDREPPRAAVVAVGSPQLRETIVNKILARWAHCEFPNIIDPSVIFTSPYSVKLGKGIVMAIGCLINPDSTIGDFCQFNNYSLIGHDNLLGDFTTTGMNPALAGNVATGKRVYIGSNASIREHIKICDDAVIGLCAGVVKDITERGTYAGVPAIKIK